RSRCAVLPGNSICRESPPGGLDLALLLASFNRGGNPVKRALRRLEMVAVLLIVVVVGYSAVVVIRARRETPELVQALMSSGRIVLHPEQFPPGWVKALLMVEDPAFYEHHGIDLSTPGAGLTTITQGLVKQLYFEHFTPGFAKVKQSLIAVFAL